MKAREKSLNLTDVAPDRATSVRLRALRNDLDAMPEVRIAMINRIQKALAAKKLPVHFLQQLAVTIEGQP